MLLLTFPILYVPMYMNLILSIYLWCIFSEYKERYFFFFSERLRSRTAKSNDPKAKNKLTFDLNSKNNDPSLCMMTQRMKDPLWKTWMGDVVAIKRIVIYTLSADTSKEANFIVVFYL